MSEQAGFEISSIEGLENVAPKFGTDDFCEMRFGRSGLGLTQTGFSHQRLHPGKRQAFGHRHEGAEEVYLVLSGSGRVKVEDEVREVSAGEVLRIDPPLTRAFEAGPDGMELLAFGPMASGDGEMVPGWWSD